ncbi:hypothetical protein ACN47E_003729 [Coniothyrium glycines]
MSNNVIINPAVRPGTTPDHVSAVEQETHRLVLEQDIANKSGNHEAAIKIGHDIVRVRLRAYKPESSQVGAAYGALGSAYANADRIHEAEEAIEKCVAIQEAAQARNDAALAREQLAQLRERQDRFDEAKAVRLRGAASDEIACANDRCPSTSFMFRMRHGYAELFTLSELKTCGACRSVFYCCKGCQKEDWKARHKLLCRDHTPTLEKVDT